MSADTFIEEPLKPLSVIHFNGEMSGTHAMVQRMLHRDVAVTEHENAPER
ncbi:hypothetical protein [Nonomuraea rhodomycinica]|uniref:Uncharacterized protein n=1 Tax=Nonomuraea rhodomycinica TaxID=1712872 RepID=A0A7Y6IT45_9ACTN|nr:hypothetical protein [Nonomuraea rhodomycinica]NUW43919.1 hypothetical protein [Nonomuraea rhodomycinica]